MIHHLDTRQVYILKSISLSSLTEDQEKELIRNLEILTKMNHPNLPKVHEWDR